MIWVWMGWAEADWKVSWAREKREAGARGRSSGARPKTMMIWPEVFASGSGVFWMTYRRSGVVVISWESWRSDGSK
ncbi:MAG: hypothetical protein G01um101416_643 [Microgenomates group bacterium Gr01-1014_16]|nr:MAG: hypothetical protein G01um101416_643 [Microgenomates group bacterium Gr01-1014_16]